MTALETAGNILLILSAVVNLEMIWKYHRLTHGAWRNTLMGRHVMAYMSATGLVLVLASIRFVTVTWLTGTDPVWFQSVRVLTYTTIPAIFLWRRHLIVQAHKDQLIDEQRERDRIADQ